MTDNEILKASDCLGKFVRNALDRINRQEAEIERLKEENKKQKAVIEHIEDTINPLPFVTDFDKAISEAKSEARKEFAKRFWIECVKILTTDTLVWIRDIKNNLLKEMEEK